MLSVSSIAAPVKLFGPVGDLTGTCDIVFCQRGKHQKRPTLSLKPEGKNIATANKYLKHGSASVSVLKLTGKWKVVTDVG